MLLLNSHTLLQNSDIKLVNKHSDDESDAYQADDGPSKGKEPSVDVSVSLFG